MCFKQNFKSKTSAFNITTTIYLTTLGKHMSCKCKCKFDDRKCNLSQKWNNYKGWCECKNLKKHHVCKKGYTWSPATCNCENGKYYWLCSDFMWWNYKKNTKTVPTNFNEKKKINCKRKNFCNLLNYYIIIDSC